MKKLRMEYSGNSIKMNIAIDPDKIEWVNDKKVRVYANRHALNTISNLSSFTMNLDDYSNVWRVEYILDGVDGSWFANIEVL